MLIDYHIHTRLCKHASGVPEDYVKQAIKEGFFEIGFADHIPMPNEYDPENRMTILELPEYINMINELKSRYSEIYIKLGIEVDYFPKYVDYVKKVIDENRFDYVLGAVHFLDEWGIDNDKYIDEFKKRDINEVYREYFDTVKKAAETKIFDVIAHFDVIKKFGYKPENGYLEIATDALETIKKNDICLEINTSGLRKEAKEVYPNDEIIVKAHELDIPITLGSDSHNPSEVGWHFNETIEKLKKIGYRKLCRFSERKRSFLSLT